ncbi:MAG: magnesium transporter [Firmicutes bacterium]|nr:magnesium transporter [Bacillota bacterium]
MNENENLEVEEIKKSTDETNITLEEKKLLDEKIKETVLGYIENKDIPKLKKYLLDAEEHDILELAEELNTDEQAIVFRLLPKDEALFVFEKLEVSEQEKLIHALAGEQAQTIFEELAPDDRASLLEELPARVAKQMLNSLSKEERAKTNLLMGYEPETAGRIMTPDYISLRGFMTASEALEKVKRQAEDKETIYTLYVTDISRKYEGHISLRELLIADPTAKIADIMTTGIDAVSTNTDQEEVARELQRLDLLSIPVVDRENRLVGIVTIDDAIDILEEEATEDMFGKAKMGSLAKGDTSEALIKGSLWQVWKVRLPFLGFTIIGGLLAAFIMGGFEDMLLIYVAPAVFFVPLVMDMGGSVGVQSSTIFIRGMTLGHINTKKIKWHIFREIGIGVSIGAIVGVISGLVAFVWQGYITSDPHLSAQGALLLGASIASAMAIVCLIASLMGFLIPYIFYKLKLDQAAATGPLITTVKDITGLLVYFGLVMLFVYLIGGYNEVAYEYCANCGYIIYG